MNYDGVIMQTIISTWIIQKFLANISLLNNDIEFVIFVYSVSLSSQKIKII